MAVVTRNRKSGKTYYVKFVWNGEDVWEPAGRDKRFARSLNRQRLQEVREGNYQPRVSADPLVGEYCRDWIGKRKVRSRDDEERALEKAVQSRSWLTGLRMSQVRGGHVFQLLDELEATTKEDGKPISPKYVANIYAVVAQVFLDAEQREVIVRSPFRSVPRKRVQRKSKKRRSIYALDAIPALIAGLNVHASSRVFAALAFFLGGREGELCGLTFADWDRSAAPLTAMRINKQYDGRPLKSDKQEAGEHERVIPVHPLLEQMLRAWWEHGFEMVHARAPMLADPIVPARAGGRRKSRALDADPGPHHTKSSAYKMWRKACVAAEVANVSLHSTRHTFITLACRRSPKEVVEVLTHNAKGEVIDIYNHKQWEDLCQVIALISLEPPRLQVVTSLVTPSVFRLPGRVEAPGVEPGSENGLHTLLRTYPALGIARGCAYRRAHPRARHLLDLASRPVPRRLAIQLGHALRRVLEDPSVGRRSVLLRQRARSRYRSQSMVPRVFTWASGPRYAAMSSSSPSKPVAPFRDTRTT